MGTDLGSSGTSIIRKACSALVAAATSEGAVMTQFCISGSIATHTRRLSEDEVPATVRQLSSTWGLTLAKAGGGSTGGGTTSGALRTASVAFGAVVTMLL